MDKLPTYKSHLLDALNDPDLAFRILEGASLTKDEVLSADFTAFARIAGAREEVSKGNLQGEGMSTKKLLFPEAASAWLQHAGLRGLPIALSLVASDGSRVPIVLRENQRAAIAHIRTWESLNIPNTLVEDTETLRASSLPVKMNGSILRMQMGLGKTLTAIA